MLPLDLVVTKLQLRLGSEAADFLRNGGHLGVVDDDTLKDLDVCTFPWGWAPLMILMTMALLLDSGLTYWFAHSFA